MRPPRRLLLLLLLGLTVGCAHERPAPAPTAPGRVRLAGQTSTGDIEKKLAELQKKVTGRLRLPDPTSELAVPDRPSAD
jgi:hypothetical protein